MTTPGERSTETTMTPPEEMLAALREFLAPYRKSGGGLR
jgi:hypothetical protein